MGSCLNASLASAAVAALLDTLGWVPKAAAGASSPAGCPASAQLRAAVWGAPAAARARSADVQWRAASQLSRQMPRAALCRRPSPGTWGQHARQRGSCGPQRLPGPLSASRHNPKFAAGAVGGAQQQTWLTPRARSARSASTRTGALARPLMELGAPPGRRRGRWAWWQPGGRMAAARGPQAAGQRAWGGWQPPGAPRPPAQHPAAPCAGLERAPRCLPCCCSGVDLEQLLDMSTDELVELFAARQRRR